MATCTITIELPEEIERQFEAAWGNGDPSRHVLEALALEGYRDEVLSAGQVSELLGLSIWETESFLKDRGAYLHYTVDDLDRDRRTHQALLGP